MSRCCACVSTSLFTTKAIWITTENAVVSHAVVSHDDAPRQAWCTVGSAPSFCAVATCETVLRNVADAGPHQNLVAYVLLVKDTQPTAELGYNTLTFECNTALSKPGVPPLTMYEYLSQYPLALRAHVRIQDDRLQQERSPSDPPSHPPTPPPGHTDDDDKDSNLDGEMPSLPCHRLVPCLSPSPTRKHARHPHVHLATRRFLVPRYLVTLP